MTGKSCSTCGNRGVCTLIAGNRAQVLRSSFSRTTPGPKGQPPRAIPVPLPIFLPMPCGGNAWVEDTHEAQVVTRAFADFVTGEHGDGGEPAADLGMGEKGLPE